MKPNRLPIIVAAVLLVVSAQPQATAQSKVSSVLPSGITIWDTGRPSKDPFKPANIAKAKTWTTIPKDQKPSSFQGDAVITNGRILAVLRKMGSSVEVFSLQPAGAESRMQLNLIDQSGEPVKRLEEVAVIENDRGAARLEAKFQTAKGSSLVAKFRIKRGDVMLETEPGAGAHRMRIDCPSRFVVLPDFFADDILIDAHQILSSDVQLPSENFLIHLTGNGNSLAMCVFENREQEVKIALSGKGPDRLITESQVTFGEGKKIWVALLESPQIWHTANVRREDSKRIQRLDWTMPFPAQWRVDFTRTNKLTDSWEMLLQPKNSKDYVKPSWMGQEADHVGPNRRRWTTVLDHFPYPCWSDQTGRGYLQPIRHKALTFEGPAVIYPINRIEETPTDAYTVVDILRNSLGVGPCEYILAVESQKDDLKGRATCSAKSALEKIYRNNEQQNKQAEIEQALDDALAFVTHIRSRITKYVEFGHEIRAYLAEQRKSHPELKEFIDEMDEIAAELEAKMSARKEDIKTPEFVANMNEDFRKNLLHSQGRGTLVKLNKYTNQLTDIGGNQDELVGECRWIVKSMRQSAGIMLATKPESGEIAKEIRVRAQKVLLNPASYESARH